MAVHNDAQSNDDGMPRRFLRMPSKRPSRAETKPQKAVEDRQKNVIQLSSAREVTAAAPPRRRLMAVTTNSAKKTMPPDDPTSWPVQTRDRDIRERMWKQEFAVAD